MEVDHLLWWLADCPDAPAGLELRTLGAEPEDVGAAPPEDTAWGLDLCDPYAWLEPEDLPQVASQSSSM